MAWTFGHSLLLILALAGGAAAGWVLRGRPGTDRTPSGMDTTTRPGTPPAAPATATTPTPTADDDTPSDTVDLTAPATAIDEPTRSPAPAQDTHDTATPPDTTDPERHRGSTDPERTDDTTAPPAHPEPTTAEPTDVGEESPHPAPATHTENLSTPATTTTHPTPTTDPTPTADTTDPEDHTPVDATPPTPTATRPAAPTDQPAPAATDSTPPAPEAAPPAEDPAPAVTATAPPAPHTTPAAEPTPDAQAVPVQRTTADPTPADDFRRIQGIGPKIATALQAAGIRTYHQLAELDEADLRELIRGAGLRSAPGLATWPQQARLLAGAPDETTRVLPTPNGS